MNVGVVSYKPIESSAGYDSYKAKWKQVSSTVVILDAIHTDTEAGNTSQETGQENQNTSIETGTGAVNTSKKDLNTSIEKSSDNKKSDDKPSFSETEQQLLTLIRENPMMTMGEMASRSGLSRAGVQYALNVLRGKGVISREGSRKKGVWVIHG